MTVDSRAILAANNNADLYEAMFAAHHLRYQRMACAFVALDPPPPYYSKLTVLLPDHRGAILRQLETLALRFDGAVDLKDSFSELDLAINGFDRLFGATWIWQEAGAGSSRHPWRPIETEAELLSWERGWKASGSPTDRRMFPASMLSRPGIIFLGRWADGRVEAGCVANRSAGCIGISNVFSRRPGDAVFAQASAAVAAVAPRSPIVGYETGGALRQAQDAGFVALGDLSVLVATAAEF